MKRLEDMREKNYQHICKEFCLGIMNMKVVENKDTPCSIFAWKHRLTSRITVGTIGSV